MKSLMKFIAVYTGKVVDVNDGENWGWPGECVSLVQMYLRECYGEQLIARGNGADWQKALLNEGLAVTTNYPSYGDIVVWGGNVANGLGHVSIYIDEMNDFDQSTGARKTAQVRSRLEVEPIAYMHLIKKRPADEAASTKTIDQLADEVIAGRWGTDPKRSKDLMAAGYDSKAVQTRVNEKLAPEKPSTPLKPPVTNIGKYANMGGETWLFKVARTDETYPGGYNIKTDLRNRSAKILAEDNGRVKISVPSFNPNVVWVANSQISVTDNPKHSVN